jgi:multiple sugar transport system permease protein
VLQRYQGYLFILPAMVLLAALILYPLADTFVLSVTNESGRYVGAENFLDVLRDDTTTLATINSIVYVGGSILFQVVLGTIAGILLNRPLFGRGALRAILLVPWVVPGIVAATSWAWMFHHEFGIINFGLMRLGVLSGPIGWLTDPDIVLPSLIAVNVWKMFPFVAVMVLAGLQGIPESLYEAARVDGARFIDEVRYIMLPHLRTVLLSVSLLLLIWGLNGITIIYAMTGGGPAQQSLILPIQIFKEAFEGFAFHRAAALSVVLFVVLFSAIVFQMRVSQRGEQADNA